MNRKYSPEQIKSFDAAWEWLQKLSPDLQSEFDQFNSSNEYNLRAKFNLERFLWMQAVIAKPGELNKDLRRAERVDGIVGLPGVGTRISTAIAIIVLNEAEQQSGAEFITAVANRHDLRIWRPMHNRIITPFNPEITRLEYQLKPNFESFGLKKK